jgi:predicted SAM-dependent methyltransferase
MRDCPICNSKKRTEIWTMPYKIPDGWPLMNAITWYTCDACGLLYGDGDFDQALLNEYYRTRYGYGINSVEVDERLTAIADWVASEAGKDVRFVDFGGSGDDGRSIAVMRLHELGYNNAWNVNAGEEVPECDIMLCSHVLEHVYDMEAVMIQITDALDEEGMLIVDGPDTTGLLLEWKVPMLDFHTKHVIHFRMIDYLRLMENWGFELMSHVQYEDVRSNQHAPCYRMYFQRRNVAQECGDLVQNNMRQRVEKLRSIQEPVNLWGLGDISWHLLAQVPELKVINYIDNDPAYRGSTYDGKQVMERPNNTHPIVITSQGQREKLIANIRKMGVTNEIIEV